MTERAARPISIDARTEISFRLLDDEGAAVGGTAPLFAHRTGLEGYLARGSEDAARLVFTVPFDTANADQPLALYLSLREQIREIRVNGVTNALRHGQATHITISSNSEGGHITLGVSDDGVGLINPGADRGLSNMRHRAEAIGATFDLVSEPGEGTRVTLTLGATT